METEAKKKIKYFCPFHKQQWVVILTHQHKGSCRDFCTDGAVYSSTMNKPSQLSTDVSTAEIAYICLDSVEMQFFKEN